MAINPNVRPELSGNEPKRRRQALKTDNSAGKRILEALGARDIKWLATQTDIPDSTIGDYVKKGISRADNAVKIAMALDCTVEWLITGSSRPRATLVSADEADWVTIEQYDLREITDDGKGEARLPTPFRRDWLHQTLGTATGLWLTRLLSDYPAAALSEGALVFCVDVEPAELLEGQLALFRINGGIVVGRFSFRARGGVLAVGDRLGEVIITSGEIGRAENEYVPVARILGALIRRV